MNVQFIGIKEFRQNMAAICAAAVKKGQQLIIMRKNKPLFELRPLKPSQEGYAEFLRGVQESREDVKKGRSYSLKEVEKLLGM